MKEPPCNKSLETKQIFKLCCRKGCDDSGIYKMNIFYLNKTGHFCSKHRSEIEQNKLGRCNLPEGTTKIDT
jgi:hypothetical protein